MLERKELQRLYSKHRIRDYGVPLPQFTYDLLRVETPDSVPHGMSSIEAKVLQLVGVYRANKHYSTFITS